MAKFTKFSEWETKKYNKVVEEEKDTTHKKEDGSPNSALLARLADAIKDRKDAIRDKDDFRAQILDVEAKLIRLEIDRNDLAKKKADLIAAQQLASVTRKEGKTNVKED
jgi:hypothetical protein